MRPQHPENDEPFKSMEDVYAKLEQAALYVERNPAIVKSITSFPYIVRSI